MKIPYESTEPDVRIELIPLIDVIFCILTFFILAAVTLTRQSAINVDLPSAETGVTQMREMLIVSVDPIGQTYIEQEPISRDQLYQRLLDYQQTNPQGLMVLYASRLASYNDVVDVLDLLRSVGGDRVALATLPESGEQAPEQFPSGLDGQINPYDPYGSPGLTQPFDPNQPLFPDVEPLPNPPTSGNSGGLTPGGNPPRCP
ncbi:MAG: biopolymer transporter ExbD [Leptolyngbyaceae cyanobacterium SL_7_1]|nr:biopolymer transporter ExbD [Leptolyngbyaceae cyanobacterium SL_7_1]